VPVSPKAFALLELLIGSRPKAVSKADIQEALWPGTHVSEASLPNLVLELRDALGDDARDSRIIRTVPRFGYAFLATVDVDRAAKDVGSSSRAIAYRLLWGRREISLDPGANLIGRDRDCAVWIDDWSVSRRHARITIGDDGATIEDLESKNGTSVGDLRIRGRTRLAEGDAVRIGPVTLRLRVVRALGSTRSTISKNSSR
jgi:hypothetical protein